jgi:hypothetical protein
MTDLKRFTGESVGTFGTQLSVDCDWPECDKFAVLLPCNAEGDRGRAHHWGGVHNLSAYKEWAPEAPDLPVEIRGPSMGNFCETHGLKILAANERRRKRRARVDADADGAHHE